MGCPPVRSARWAEYEFIAIVQDYDCVRWMSGGGEDDTHDGDLVRCRDVVETGCVVLCFYAYSFTSLVNLPWQKEGSMKTFESFGSVFMVFYFRLHLNASVSGFTTYGLMYGGMLFCSNNFGDIGNAMQLQGVDSAHFSRNQPRLH